MIIKLLIGTLVGTGIGAIMGHVGRCSSGACPLTATPIRGAIYGGILGLIITLSSGETAGPAPSAAPTEKKQMEPGQDVIHISSDEEFTRYVIHASLPCLVDFYSDYCPPCRHLAPTIEKLAEKYRGRAVICKVNTVTAPQLARAFAINGIPAVLFFDGGREMGRLVGLRPQESYERVLNRLLQSRKNTE